MSEMSPIACETFCDDGGTCGGFIDDPIYIASVYTLGKVITLLCCCRCYGHPAQYRSF